MTNTPCLERRLSGLFIATLKQLYVTTVSAHTQRCTGNLVEFGSCSTTQSTRIGGRQRLTEVLLISIWLPRKSVRKSQAQSCHSCALTQVGVEHTYEVQYRTQS